MGLSKAEAHDILELPIGADPDSIRTSYKRLALKWHPDKHPISAPEVAKNFLHISLAYKRLTTDNENVHMSLDDSYDLYKQIFFPKHTTTYSNGYDSSDDDDSDDDDDEDEYDYLNMFAGKFPIGKDRKSREDFGLGSKSLSPEEIEKNANELITEEEKEKRRAEKRRAKKKRRREKKRMEKQSVDKKEEEGQKLKSKQKEGIDGDRIRSKKDKKKIGSTGAEAEEFDTSAAFFTQVVNKKKKAGGVGENTAGAKTKSGDSRTQNGTEETIEDIDPIVLRSRQLAIRGNEMANSGHYQAAIDLFAEAIKLDGRDFRFFGNRSYCFDRMQQYEKALKDAEKAINLAPDWPKGYFRKGRALAGLKLYADAEQAFMQVLRLDRNCEDAMQELLRVRTHQLTEMGFSRQQAEQAIRQYDTVQQALDSLLAGVVAENSLASEVYQSDEEDYTVSAALPTPPTFTGAMSGLEMHDEDLKMDPNNPEGLTALWVGNVLPTVGEKKLKEMFAKYGVVTSVRMLPDKYCAFINYKTKESAGKAMHALQATECAGQRLLIKFPDNPICNGNVVFRKGAPATTTTKSTSSFPSGSTSNSSLGSSSTASVPAPAAAAAAAATATTTTPTMAMLQQQLEQQKLSGPVNGDECYFWRTTGCHFGKNCRHQHIPEHKGLDRKAWQKISEDSE